MQVVARRVAQKQEVACTVCRRMFPSMVSMTNHRRWHNLPKFKAFQRKFAAGASQWNSGENNGHWVGDRIKYGGIHTWVRKRLKKPERCNRCGKKTTFLDRANISQKYLRDLTDWEWLCRSCHMKSDGRMLNLKQFRNVL